MWDLESGECLLTHHCSAAGSAITATATGIIAGDVAGAAWFLDGPPRSATRPASLQDLVFDAIASSDVAKAEADAAGAWSS